MRSNRRFSLFRAVVGLLIASLAAAIVVYFLSDSNIFGSEMLELGSDSIWFNSIAIFVVSGFFALIVWPIAIKVRYDGILPALIIAVSIAAFFGYYSWSDVNYPPDVYTGGRDPDAPWFPNRSQGAIFFGSIAAVHVILTWLFTYAAAPAISKSC